MALQLQLPLQQLQQQQEPGWAGPVQLQPALLPEGQEEEQTAPEQPLAGQQAQVQAQVQVQAQAQAQAQAQEQAQVQAWLAAAELPALPPPPLRERLTWWRLKSHEGMVGVDQKGDPDAICVGFEIANLQRHAAVGLVRCKAPKHRSRSLHS